MNQTNTAPLNYHIKLFGGFSPAECNFPSELSRYHPTITVTGKITKQILKVGHKVCQGIRWIKKGVKMEINLPFGLPTIHHNGNNRRKRTAFASFKPLFPSLYHVTQKMQADQGLRKALRRKCKVLFLVDRKHSSYSILKNLCKLLMAEIRITINPDWQDFIRNVYLIEIYLKSQIKRSRP